MIKSLSNVFNTFKRFIRYIFIKLKFMSFENSSKSIIENIIKSTFPNLSELTVNIISVEQQDNTGYTILKFELINNYLHVKYTFSFGKDQNQTPYIYAKKYQVLSEFDYNTPVPYSEIIGFPQSNLQELLENYVRFYK